MKPDTNGIQIEIKIYTKRQETMERVFTDLKQKLGLRLTNLKRVKKI